MQNEFPSYMPDHIFNSKRKIVHEVPDDSNLRPEKRTNRGIQPHFINSLTSTDNTMLTENVLPRLINSENVCFFNFPFLRNCPFKHIFSTWYF